MYRIVPKKWLGVEDKLRTWVVNKFGKKVVEESKLIYIEKTGKLVDKGCYIVVARGFAL
jgi:hypothetical protein